MTTDKQTNKEQTTKEENGKFSLRHKIVTIMDDDNNNNKQIKTPNEAR